MEEEEEKAHKRARTERTEAGGTEAGTGALEPSDSAAKWKCRHCLCLHPADFAGCGKCLKTRKECEEQEQEQEHDLLRSDAPQEMTASQVATMVGEMLAGVYEGAPGMDQMMKMCFAEAVTVCTLSQRQQLIKGRDSVIAALITSALVGKTKGQTQLAEPIARVVAEGLCKNGTNSLVSMALDVYAGGKSPFGALAKGGGGGSLVVFRARRCQIDHIWVGDCGAGAKLMCVSKESFVNSSTFPAFLMSIRLSLLPDPAHAHAARPAADEHAAHASHALADAAPALVTFVLNNYAQSVDKAGLGLGSETLSETWTQELLATTEDAIKEAERLRKQEQLDKSLAALAKVTGPLESDKKLAKAAPIFLSMLKSETREETADAVIKAATAALGGGFQRVGTEGVRDALKEAAEVLLEKKDVLLQGTSMGKSKVEGLLEAWRLEHVVAHDLRTDDTFQFAKAGKVLLHVLEKLPVVGGVKSAFDEQAVEVDAQGRDALAEGMMACLSVMESKYVFAWARAPLDMCTKVLVNPHKRKHFGKHEQSLVEILGRLNKKKHGQTSEDSKLHYQTSSFQHGRMGW